MSRRVLNIAVFRLVRWPNLLITILVQYLLYFRFLAPVFSESDILPRLDYLRFFMLVSATLCIMAGGYIVNDIIDVRADLINRPARVIVGKRIAHQTAYWLYFMFQLTGFALWLYLVFYVQHIPLLSIFLLLSGGLLFYSLILKRLPLAGNIWVALYCAAVPGIVWLSECESLYTILLLNEELYHRTTAFLWWYVAAAFGFTLYRELIKDMEDIHGDTATGSRTLPVIWGLAVAKRIAVSIALALVVFTGLMLWQLPQWSAWSRAGYGATVLLPLGISIFLLIRADGTSDYHRLSHLAKWIIFMGMLLPLWV